MSKAAIYFQKFTVYTFYYRRAQVTKFDRVIKEVKVKPGSFFINFIELESPMLHAKFQDYRTSGS